jgi:hypothetical protein
MPCVKPIQAYQHVDGGALVFGAEPKNHRSLEIACGQCIGCRLTKSRHWATRIVHEAQCHEENVFITLTYNPENLPPDCGLRKKDFQDFMKRLRKAFPNNKIRFYHCGEYGDNTNRPHYHAILHGINFSDWYYLFDSPSGQPIYTSPTLEKIWSKGFVTIGEVTFESAAYVARYVVKKITGKGQDKIDENTGLKPYERINSFTGEITPVLPEYSTMSRGGTTGNGTNLRGIGYQWFRQFNSDVYPKDFTTIRGNRVAPPRVYDNYLRELDLDMYDDIKAARMLSISQSLDTSEERLRSREKVLNAQNSQLKRSL